MTTLEVRKVNLAIVDVIEDKSLAFFKRNSCQARAFDIAPFQSQFKVSFGLCFDRSFFLELVLELPSHLNFGHPSAYFLGTKVVNGGASSQKAARVHRKF